MIGRLLGSFGEQLLVGDHPGCSMSARGTLALERTFQLDEAAGILAASRLTQENCTSSICPSW
jgi:hypothetical protein